MSNEYTTPEACYFKAPVRRLTSQERAIMVALEQDDMQNMVERELEPTKQAEKLW